MCSALAFLASAFLVSARADGPSASLSGQVSAEGAPQTWLIHVRLEPGGRETIATPDRIFFFDNLGAGNYSLHASAAGYPEAVEIVTLDAGERRHVQLRLTSAKNALSTREPAQTEAGEVVVTAEARRAIGEQVLHADAVSKSPASLLPDLSRSIQMLPGVTSIGNLDARPYIEGGNADETLSLVDGVFVPFPFHFGGLASLLNPEAFEKADLFAAGYPAEYGQALAAIIFSDLREGGDKPEGEFNFSPVQTDGRVSGPWADGNGGWMFTGRRLTYDLLLNPLKNTSLLSGTSGYTFPFFYDFENTLTRRLGDGRHDLRISTLFTEEVLKLDAATNDNLRHIYNIGFVSARWRGPLPFGGVGEVRATYLHEQDTDTENNLGHISTFRVWSWEAQTAAKASWALPWGHVVDLGEYFDHDEMEAHSRDSCAQQDPNVQVPDLSNHGINYSGTYLQDRWEGVDGRLAVTAGFRLEHFSLTREYVSSPRASLEWRVAPQTTLKAAWGKYSQYPRDVWTLALNPQLRSPKATHYVVSLDQSVGAWDGRVQIYDKPGASIVNENFGLGDALPGESRVYGAEFSWGRRVRASDPIQGWIAYSYGVAQQQPDGQGWQWVDNDQRHTISANWTLRLAPRWTFSGSWRFRSGRPYTTETSVSNPIDPSTGQSFKDPCTGSDTTLVPGPFNASRMPPWHQLDLRIDHEWPLAHGGTISGFVAVQNIYDHQNVYQENYDSTGKRTPTLDLPWFPLPLLGASAKF